MRLSLFLLLLISTTLQAAEVADPDPNRYASAFVTFAQQDQNDPFPKGGTVFVGSSSIRMLDIPTVFPGIEALNRGFGGAHISDLNHYLEKALLQYEPTTVVFFCGGNDLWSGKSPAQVMEDFNEFTTRLFTRVPKAELIVLAWRPSIARFSIIDQERSFNAMLEAAAQQEGRMVYLEGSYSRYLNGRGYPREELFLSDGLHMNAAGYEIWGEILRPLLKPLFLVGGDISTLAKIEGLGGIFQDANGPGDAIDILCNQGWNCFRLRLFVNPTMRNAVVQDLDYSLALARRIKAAGAQLLLDLHYSDTWADPAHQNKPAAWENLSFGELALQVQTYSQDVIEAFKSEGVLPDIVQVGNEITPGFLWPEGQIYHDDDEREHWNEFTTLLKAGIAGVKAPLEAGDHLRIMIHIDCGARLERTQNFFTQLAQYEVEYDIIGQSYYPWWHGTLADVQVNQAATAKAFGKDIMIVETAYPWSNANYWQAQDNMAWPVTVEGQALFLAQLAQVVRETPDNRGLGVNYWYPEAIEVDGMHIWNGGATALFDSNGLILPGAHAITEPIDLKEDFYIGTYTNQGGSQGIYQSTLNLVDGGSSTPVLMAESPDPSFLAISQDHQYLLALGSQEGQGLIKSLQINPTHGELTLINQQLTQGNGPCHINISRDGHSILVAHYGSGSVASLPLAPDGTLSPPVSVKQHHGSSVHPDRQQGPHAHSVDLSPDGRLVLACDLGIDKVMLYRLDPQTSVLTPHDPPYITLTPGAGPRHLVFHPNGQWLYVLNELNSTITSFAYNSQLGTFKQLYTLSTLPEAYTAFNKAAEISIHPNGRWLYASNRGHNSIVAFTIDPQNGQLTLIEHETEDIDTPRHFSLDPSGQYCLVANRNGHRINSFRIDMANGELSPLHQSVDVFDPVCILFRQ